LIAIGEMYVIKLHYLNKLILQLFCNIINVVLFTILYSQLMKLNYIVFVKYELLYLQYGFCTIHW